MQAKRRVFASAIAAIGSSKAPGTGITVIASRGDTARSSSASALSRSRDVTSPLKRLTTTPTARRSPRGSPSSTAKPGGTTSSPGACSGGSGSDVDRLDRLVALHRRGSCAGSASIRRGRLVVELRR